MREEPNDIKQIVAKYLAGEASPLEEDSLIRWISSSKENKIEFEKAKRIFDAASYDSAGVTLPVINVEEEWASFLNKVGETTTNQLPASQHTTLWFRIAASILLVVAGAATIFFYSTRVETFTVTTTSALRKVELPDGSTIVLNRKSGISYDSDYGKKNRLIALQGEAFFDVERNESVPFVITARSTKIEVLGTSFNVSAYDSLDNVNVVVATGTVQLSSMKGNEKISLVAGEKGAVDMMTNAAEKAVNDDPNFSAWNTKTLIFTETNLQSVIQAINKAYNSDIVIVGPVSPSCVLTASFKDQSLESVLKVLESTLNLVYTRSANRIEIVSAGC